MQKNQGVLLNWLLFVLLSLIWGSSFVLMKVGLEKLTAYQVAALRIVSSGLVLLPWATRFLPSIPKSKLGHVFLSGMLGSLLPAFLFCVAEEEIDSALAGTLNALTPIFVIITGALFFQAKPGSAKITGILISFTGTILLFISKGHIKESHHQYMVSLVVLATFLYGYNVNMVGKHLKEIPSLHIASVALCGNAVIAFVILLASGFFQLPLMQRAYLNASLASVVLGIGGTAIATVLFYMLVKRAGSVFASTVTYGIPFVAIGWGLAFKESFGLGQLLSLMVILVGVYVANRK